MKLDGKAELRTVDVLLWLYRQKPGLFTVRDIMDRYSMTRGEAQRRLNYMMIWGAVRRSGQIESHRPGRKSSGYEITKWGRKYGERRGSSGRSKVSDKAAN